MPTKWATAFDKKQKDLLWVSPFLLRKRKNKLKNERNERKDKRLGILRFQAVYLYDKGENDELFHVNGCAQPIYKYILSCIPKKVKKNF